MWASADGSLWFIGGENGTLLRGDGETWEQLTVPGLRPADVITDFAGLSPDDVWAIGDSIILHFDGHEWR